jgi:hypothetical protein
MPLLAHPAALFSLLALPALLGIYFLYSRFRRREVSSVFLWLSLGRQTAGRGRVRAAMPPLSFWLESLALLCLSLAAVGLCWPAAQRLRPLVVVLDDSLSMQAVVGGSSARTRAETLLRRELRRLQPTSVRLALAGRTVQIGARLPLPDLGRALAAWQCRAMSADLSAALAAVQAQDPSAWVVVLTDQPPAKALDDRRTRWLSSGLPAANAGIVNAARTALGAETDRVLVDVRLLGQPVAPVLLTLRAGDRELHRETLDPARESTAVVITVPADGTTLAVDLSADALAADNHSALPPAWRPHLQPFVQIGQPELQRAVLRAIGAAGMQPASAAGSGLTLTDDPAAASSTGGDWRVCFHAPAAGAGRSHSGPFVLDHAHPLCEGLDLDGVLWHAAAAPGEGLPVLLAGDVPLLRDRELPGGAHVLDIALDPGRSTLLQSSAWPTLVWNLLYWRARATPGFGTAYARCGEWLLVTTAQAGETVRLTLPEGTEAVLRPPLGSRETGFIPEQPGLYRAQTAAGVFELACLPGSADESDLRACATASFGDMGGVLAEEHGYWNSATLFGLLAAAALAAQGWLLYRRRGGALGARETLA